MERVKGEHLMKVLFKTRKTGEFQSVKVGWSWIPLFFGSFLFGSFLSKAQILLPDAL
jgi:hypothetical protein